MHYHTAMPDEVNIRFYAELNLLLPAEQRDIGFNYEIRKRRSVKDLIESIGVPHTEVDLIFVNDQSVDFTYQVEGGEQIRIYPSCSNFDNPALIHNQPDTPEEPGFLADVHLGRLATYLRMLGFDTLYRNDYEDATLAHISAQQNRILLTCDRKLLMRKAVSHGYLVKSRKPRRQIHEVLKRFDLFEYRNKHARCLRCNGIIHSVTKQAVEARLMPLTKKYYDDFFRCDSCGKIYWEGSHHQKIQTLVAILRAGG
jgi:uncharacterized protein with PIN domain